MASIPLAFFFYFHSPSHRELVCAVSASKAVVVRAGQTSRLSVLLDAKPFAGEVTAAQIAFWNDGNEAIHRENVLEPLVVQLKSPIIDASIRTTTRRVVNASLDKSHLGSGELGISWKILEHDDGGVVQIIFAGSPETAINASAIIEGQGHVAAQSQEEVDAVRFPTRFTFFAVTLLISLAGTFILHLLRKKSLFSMLFIYFAICGTVVAVIRLALNFFEVPAPPFPF
jgi:hypothetical protein